METKELKEWIWGEFTLGGGYIQGKICDSNLLIESTPDRVALSRVDVGVRATTSGPPQVTFSGQSGDEGIDGIIREDRLGLEVIYLQAKRWQGAVGRPEIQRFVGALHGKHARKGVFITTSSFTQDARHYVAVSIAKSYW